VNNCIESKSGNARSFFFRQWMKYGLLWAKISRAIVTLRGMGNWREGYDELNLCWWKVKWRRSVKWVIHITTLKILVKSEICRACEVNRNHKKFILTPVHTLCICNVLAQLHERDESSSKWKERLLGTFLTLLKKLELHVGFEQQIKHSGSSERKKTKLDWTNLFILASLLVKI
jgi:hypothetical protein